LWQYTLISKRVDDVKQNCERDINVSLTLQVTLRYTMYYTLTLHLDFCVLWNDSDRENKVQ